MDALLDEQEGGLIYMRAVSRFCIDSIDSIVAATSGLPVMELMVIE